MLLTIDVVVFGMEKKTDAENARVVANGCAFQRVLAF